MTTEYRLGIPREPCTMSKVWGVRVQAAWQEKQTGPSSPFGLGLLTATWLLHHSAKIPTASTVAWQAIVLTHLWRKNNFLVFSFVKKVSCAIYQLQAVQLLSLTPDRPHPGCHSQVGQHNMLLFLPLVPTLHSKLKKKAQQLIFAQRHPQ